MLPSDRDALNFNKGVLGQGGNLYAAAGGEAGVEVGAVNLVHGTEIGQILHKNGRLDDIVQREACLLQDSLQILQCLMGLGLHALGQRAGGGVKAELAASIDGGACIDRLRIGAESGGCVGGGNVFHGGNLLYVS